MNYNSYYYDYYSLDLIMNSRTSIIIDKSLRKTSKKYKKNDVRGGKETKSRNKHKIQIPNPPFVLYFIGDRYFQTRDKELGRTSKSER